MATSKSTSRDSPSEHITSDAFHDKEGNQGEKQLLSNDKGRKQFTPPIGPNAGEYKMHHERRGKAIIFNHEKYHEALSLREREGTHTDKIILKQRLEKLKFEVDVHDDLTEAQIKDCLNEVSNQDHKNEDCLIVAVLTHGGGKGKLFAHDGFYKVDVLWSCFTADKCPSLGGKPKIFIVQACRGDETSQRMNFRSSVQIDSNKMNKDTVSHRYSIPVEADILIAFSTYEGRVALRNIDEGTWFIQELCKELEENGEKIDLLTLFTNVNRRVAVNREYKTFKQMPVVQSTLTRQLFLNKAPISHSGTTVTSDIDKLLRETNEKLDHMTRMFDNEKVSTSVQKTRSARKQTSLQNWDSLQSLVNATNITLPQAEVIYKYGEALKFFLDDEGAKLKQPVREEGETVLNFLSRWEYLNEELKGFVYKKVVTFLNENARDWKVFKFLDLPDSVIFGEQHCHRRHSQSDVTDAGSSHNKTATIPRRIITKRKF